MSSPLHMTTSESLFKATFLTFFQNIPQNYQGTVIRDFKISITTTTGLHALPLIRVVIKLRHKTGATATNLIGHSLTGIQYLIDEEIWDIVRCSDPSDNGTYRLIITISIDDNNRYRIIRTRLYQDYNRPSTLKPSPPREQFINTKSIIDQLQLERTQQEESLNLPMTTQRHQTSIDEDSEWDILSRDLLTISPTLRQD